MLGAITVIGADPLWPSLVAVMLAKPAVRALTTPDAFTVAMEGMSDDQVTARSLRMLPFASLRLAVAWVVAPTVIADEASDTDTVATGTTITVTVAAPLRPSLDALTLAVPAC